MAWNIHLSTHNRYASLKEYQNSHSFAYENPDTH